MNPCKLMKNRNPGQLISNYFHTAHDFTIVSNWIPLIKLLKLLGNAPIQIKQLNTQNVPGQLAFDLKVRWISPIIICILLPWFIIRVIFALTVFTPELFPFPSSSLISNLSQTEILIQPFRIYCLPVIYWLEWISILICFPDFIQFLNNWQIFNQNTTAEWKTGNCKPVGRYLAYHVMLSILLTIAAGILGIANSWTSGDCSNRVYFTIALSLLNQFIVTVEDLKVLLMFCSVSTGISKVNDLLPRFVIRHRL